MKTFLHLPVRVRALKAAPDTAGRLLFRSKGLRPLDPRLLTKRTDKNNLRYFEKRSLKTVGATIGRPHKAQCNFFTVKGIECVYRRTCNARPYSYIKLYFKLTTREFCQWSEGGAEAPPFLICVFSFGAALYKAHFFCCTFTALMNLSKALLKLRSFAATMVVMPVSAPDAMKIGTILRISPFVSEQ